MNEPMPNALSGSYARRLTAGKRGYARRAAWVAGVLGACWLAAALVHYARERVIAPFRVKQVLLDVRRDGQPVPPGQYRFDEEALRRSLPFAPGDFLPLIDPHAVRDALLAQPAIKAANVHLQLPDTVLMQAEERVPTAIVRRDGVDFLIDGDGVNIGPAAGRTDLLQVSGEGCERINAPENHFLFDAARQGLIRSAVRVGRRRWNVLVARDVLLMLPEKAPEAALRRFAQLNAGERLTGRQIASIDMRTPGRLYLRAQ